MVPRIGHISVHFSATQRPLMRLTTIKNDATHLEEIKIAVVVLSADNNALSADVKEPRSK
ncbi:hypothetical protein VoSk93_12320 [Vibrio owensii]